MTSFFYVVSTVFHTSVPALRKCMDTSRKKILLADSTATCAPPATGWGEPVTELMLFVKFLVHSYTCCSNIHASTYWTFIHRWISMGFTPSLPKKKDVVWCMSQVGSPSLHYYCAVMLHPCIILPPVSHSSNHEYHCFQLTRQSNCFSNFYCTFKVFIWLSYVYQLREMFRLALTEWN
jgi:hypothetical protein